MDSPGAFAARRWSRGKCAGIAALIVGAAIGASVLADSLFHLRPIAAERFWIAALRFGVTPLREEAVFRLRNHPTRAVAVALVYDIHRSVGAGDWKDAARATETLCVLSGRSYRTVGEALMAMMYREGKWKIDYQDDWRAWWELNRTHYGL